MRTIKWAAVGSDNYWSASPTDDSEDKISNWSQYPPACRGLSTLTQELSDANYKKLKRSILKHGITFPFFIWQDNGTNFILDGTQRDRALRKLAADGYDIPPLPCAIITARDKREACEKILLISSQYGKMTNDSLYEFISKNELGFLELEEMLDLPQIKLEEFKIAWLQEPDFEANQNSNICCRSMMKLPNVSSC